MQFGKKVDVDITSEEGKAEYIKEIVASLKDEKGLTKERKKMMEASATKFLWKDVAAQWKEEFDKHAEEGILL